MEKKNQAAGKTAKKFSGVMLALKAEDARVLSEFIKDKISPTPEVRVDSEKRLVKISGRIEKQIGKRRMEEINLMKGTEKETGDGLVEEEGGNQTEPEVENEKNDI